MKLVGRYLECARNLHVPLPYFALLSFVFVKGLKFALGPERGGDRTLMGAEDTLMLPEVMMEDASVEPARALRPLFDMVWNAFGMHRSFNYDGEDNWSG